jgi:hypothetical protein
VLARNSNALPKCAGGFSSALVTCPYTASPRAPLPRPERFMLTPETMVEHGIEKERNFVAI